MIHSVWAGPYNQYGSLYGYEGILTKMIVRRALSREIFSIKAMCVNLNFSGGDIAKK